MAQPISAQVYAVVVVHRDIPQGKRQRKRTRPDQQFLLIQELPKHDRKWYLTVGRVEQGEERFDGAKREVLEEGGIPIELEGFIEIQHTIADGVLWLRFILVARPADDTAPKNVADEHSLQAAWFTLAQVKELKQ